MNHKMISVKAHSQSLEWRKWLAIALVTVGLTSLQGPKSLCQEKPANPDSLKNRFRTELRMLQQQYEFPGATAAFILPDETIGAVATGLADVEAQNPMSTDSRMLAASIGKTFTGAVALALSQENRLKLDDPVSGWLGNRPWFRRLPNHASITLRHLLNHTAGIPNHVEQASFQTELGQRWQELDNPLSPEDLVGFVLDQPPLFKPGEGWHYSDTGYILVGMIIEKVTGQRFEKEVTRRFLEPLHLDLTTPSNRRKLPGLAAGYLAPDNAFNLPEKTTSKSGVMVWHPGIESTGGGFISNPKDLVVWAKALFEGHALPGDYLETLLQSVPVDPENPDIRYGIGVGIYQNGPLGPTYGHGGWIPGYCSSLRYYPQYGIAVAFQINTDVGIMDTATPVIAEMEKRLAEIVVAGLGK